MRLIPVDITKPWGKEIWYSGMEARGESQVQLGGQQLPLSVYLKSDPARLSRGTPVLLLKVLDPKPQPVLGDLYFEVHETKQEVYVVTHIDPGAWPDGVGGIRLGMNQDKRAQYDNANAFRAAYLRAVKSYEHVRRQIDEQGADISTADEELARTRMDSFTNLLPLRVGDVVRVPTWTPHSLLHGVRVVEFQTATYERFIISFAQQVVTQKHWDSEHAIANMLLEAPPRESFEAVSEGIERIASFSDFQCVAGGSQCSWTHRVATRHPLCGMHVYNRNVTRWRRDTTAGASMFRAARRPRASCIDGYGHSTGGSARSMKYLSRRATFLAVVLAVAGLVLVYPPIRLASLLLPGWTPSIWLVLALFALPVGLRLIHERTQHAWSRAVTALVMTWLGVCFILLSLLVPTELVLLSGFVSCAEHWPERRRAGPRVEPVQLYQRPAIARAYGRSQRPSLGPGQTPGTDL